MTTMTVWRQRTYGSAAVVRPETVPLPIPGRGEVLVHVDAASLNAGDIHLMRGEPLLVRTFAGFGRPRVAGRGMDFARSPRSGRMLRGSRSVTASSVPGARRSPAPSPSRRSGSSGFPTG
jgi:hypothetical protein